jgi:hypothetical protein
VICLTGGLASGKSTAARFLKEQGAHVIDADVLGHRTYEPGSPAHAQVAAAFGPDVLAADGTIDRKALGGKVFGKPQELKRLTDIVWPAIRALAEDEIAKVRAAGTPRVIVLECSGIPDIEYTALVALAEAEQRLRDRGVALWLAGVNPYLAPVLARSPLTAAADPNRSFADLHRALEAWQRGVAPPYALGTADLLGQMAARDYIEKLPVLFSEFAEAANTDKVNGARFAQYETAADVVRGTPSFWSDYAWPRINEDFSRLYVFLNDPIPDGPNPYLLGVQKNLARLQEHLKQS